MELYYMLAVVDQDREKTFRKLCTDQKIPVVLTTLGKGTAAAAHLRIYDLQPTEKSVLGTLVTAPCMKNLIRECKQKMYMDIPGNGVMMYIPVKSVSGKKTLNIFMGNQKKGGTVPSMEFKNELIVVILNEGYADMVMDAAREAGATGGTILHAKGTGGKVNGKFFHVSVAEEKDMLYILASARKKSLIMKAISGSCGLDTEAGAICFSLPVSETVGIRRLEDDEET